MSINWKEIKEKNQRKISERKQHLRESYLPDELKKYYINNGIRPLIKKDSDYSKTELIEKIIKYEQKTGKLPTV